MTKEDIMKNIPSDTDTSPYWTSAYRRILQIAPKTKCITEEQKDACLLAAEGLYLDHWRRDKRLCITLQKENDVSNYPPTPQISQDKRDQLIAKFLHENKMLGRCQ